MEKVREYLEEDSLNTRAASYGAIALGTGLFSIYQFSEGETYPLEITAETTLAVSGVSGTAGIMSLYRDYLDDNREY